jgi:sugar/nucleoside kinase (ribokinase family)
VKWVCTVAKVAVFGSVTMEFTFRVTEWPERGKSVQGEATGELGGKGLFQAVAARRMNLETVLISSVGQDAYGELARERLAHFSVEDCIEGIRVDKARGFSTDVAGLIVDRTSGLSGTIGCREATDKLSDQFVETKVRAVLEEADALLVTFDASLAQAEHIIRLARDLDPPVPVVVNASPPASASFTMLKNVQYLVATVKEAREWLRLKRAEPEEKYTDEEIAGLLLKQGPQGVILTVGPSKDEDGCLVLDRKRDDVVRRYNSYRPMTRSAVGARSLFCAGVLAASTEALLRGDDLWDPQTEHRIISFASAAKCMAANSRATHADALPHRDAIEDVIQSDDPLTVEMVSLPKTQKRTRAVADSASTG